MSQDNLKQCDTCQVNISGRKRKFCSKHCRWVRHNITKRSQKSRLFKSWYERNKEKVLAEDKEQYQIRKQSDPEGLYLMAREHNMKLKFGIDLEQYEKLLQQQGGVCAICKQLETAKYKDRVRKLAIDHNHTTGEIRGLLCVSCNTILGHAEEDVSILKNIIEYIRKHNHGD